ncbi:7333_t:CDS:1 [Scutellospora calospora]|uniref:7333_t:CDS:1 n=1 Tax=Scutellospora calospora TaxID=85575 RepID=A0ACA9LFR2_9GLOM|nr:7333_t:CDS:1 [Scutellospora calospora]
MNNNLTREKRDYDGVFLQQQPIKNRECLQQFVQKRIKLNEDEYVDNSGENFHLNLHKNMRSRFVASYSTCRKTSPSHFKCQSRRNLCTSLRILQSKDKVPQYPSESLTQIMTNNVNEISRSINKVPEIMHDRLCMVNNQNRVPTTNINISNNTRIPVNATSINRNLSIVTNHFEALENDEQEFLNNNTSVTEHLDAPEKDNQEFSNLNIIPSLISERYRKAVFVENLVGE